MRSVAIVEVGAALAMSGALLVAGCSGGNTYLPKYNKSFSARATPAKILKRKPDPANRSALRIGRLKSRVDVAKCESDSPLTPSTCDKPTNTETATDKLRREAAARGADFIFLTANNKKMYRPTSKGSKCAKWEGGGWFAGAGQYNPSKGGINQNPNPRKCVRWTGKRRSVQFMRSEGDLYRTVDSSLVGDRRIDNFERVLEKNNYRAVRALLKADPSLDKVRKRRKYGDQMYNFHPLHSAIHGHAPNSIRALLDAGFDPNAKMMKTLVPLDVALTVYNSDKTTDRQRPQALKCFEILLQRGADLTVRDYAGRTPLHSAALHGRPKIVALLIRHGADKKNPITRKFTLQPSKIGKSPYEIAVTQYKAKKYLARKNPNPKDWAEVMRYEKTVELLFDWDKHRRPKRS